jgi:dimethylargininase
LTYLSREPIDIALARQQHATYEALLASLGFQIVRLAALDDQPDAVFVEDAAIALDELAVVAPMGAGSRSAESATVATELSRHLPVTHLSPPARLDGGDVLRVARRVFVGQSRRTNAAAVDQLARVLAPYGYEVIPVAVDGALHLKSACSYLGGDTILANPSWVDVGVFHGFETIAADPAEPWSASVLRTGETLVMPLGFPRTAAGLRGRGWSVVEIDLSELRKAEGGPTCLSILLRQPAT